MNTRKTIIKHVITMGDSLTDRGTMGKRKLWGTIPMSYILGLDETSPKGRFTNGYTWDDDFGAMLASMLIAKDYKAKSSSLPVKTQDDTDLADDIIDGEFTVISRRSYSLNDDLLIRYKGENFLRSYAEGGLSAYDYSRSWFSSTFFQRELVSTLGAKRKALLSDDSKYNTTLQEKAETLVIELSGANDLFTVNSAPTKEIVENAIKARMENVNELIRNGYSNFVLIGLCDISLTPKFQQKSSEDQANMHSCCIYFNTRLKEEIEKLQLNPGLLINYFDINAIVTNVYQHPEVYGFDPSKLKQPFTTSTDFKMVDGISHAPGYLFWDDVHPTAHMHALIAEHFYEQYSGIYDVEVPASLVVNAGAQSMCEDFIVNYRKKLDLDRESAGGSFRTSHLLDKLKSISVEEEQSEQDFINEIAIILDHAINGGGVRTKSVLMDMGWIDTDNNINVYIAALFEASKRLNDAIPDENHRETQQRRI